MVTTLSPNRSYTPTTLVTSTAETVTCPTCGTRYRKPKRGYWVHHCLSTPTRTG